MPATSEGKADQLADLDTMFLAEYGSRATGTHTADSDHDLMGIYVETDDQLYGFEPALSQVYRTHADGQVERFDDKLDATMGRSVSSDTEILMYPLKDYLKLAAAGNPSVLILPWATDELTRRSSAGGQLLQAARHRFITKHAVYRHAGYARSQRQALMGGRSKSTKRPELVAEFGHDTKYAGHLIRLLLQGIELIETRTYRLPMRPEYVAEVAAVRAGQVSLDNVIARSVDLEALLNQLTRDSDLPDKVSWDFVNCLAKEIRYTHLGLS